MALLDEANRQALRNYWMRRFGTHITKDDLRAAINATDDWIDANAAAYNAAIPQPARAQLTSDQKTLLFCFVALRRAGFGEVL